MSPALSLAAVLLTALFCTALSVAAAACICLFASGSITLPHKKRAEKEAADGTENTAPSPLTEQLISEWLYGRSQS